MYVVKNILIYIFFGKMLYNKFNVYSRCKFYYLFSLRFIGYVNK